MMCAAIEWHSDTSQYRVGEVFNSDDVPSRSNMRGSQPELKRRCSNVFPLDNEPHYPPDLHV
jgi:hypothetical protein